MANVTRIPSRAYDFTPQDQKFAKKVQVTLPYDPAAVGKDFH